MLSSWFGQKSPEEGPSERTTPRPSFSSPPHIQRSSTEKAPKRAFPTAYTTPHDAIIVDLQAPTARPTPVDPSCAADEQVPSPEPELTATRESRADSKSMSGAQSGFQQQSPRSQLLLDPFDGNVLGVLVPHQEQGSANEDMSPSQVNLSTNRDANVGTNNADTRSEAVWSHLSRILDLQGQLSKMHLKMEDIGTGKAAGSKRKKQKQRDEGVPESPNPGLDPEDPLVPPGLQPRKRTMSTGSRGSEADGDEEGVNMPSEEAEKDRIREEEFAKLATQFEGRKDAINEIMGKLDDLSKLLFEFHDLKSPDIDFPGRSTSISTSPQGGSTPHLGSGEAEYKGNTDPLAQSTSTTSNQKENATSSSSKMHVPLGRAQNGTTTTNVPGTTLQKNLLPTLSLDPQVQAVFVDSPTSTIGSMKLPRKE